MENNELRLFSVLPIDNICGKLYGRSYEINGLIFPALTKYQNISLIGEKMIGKTSILKCIETEIKGNKKFDNIIPIYIDLDLWSFDLKSEHLIETFLINIYSENSKLKEAVSREKFDKREFVDLIEYCSRNNLIILLMLDQFDCVNVLSNLTEDFFSFLRGNASKRGLSIITSSRDKLENLCHKGQIAGSYFWAIFNPIIYLNLINDIGEINELLSQEFENKNLIDFIIGQIGCHIGYIKIGANALLENNEIYDNEYERKTELLYDRLKPYYSKNLDKLAIDEENIEKGRAFKLEYIQTLMNILNKRIYDKEKYKREINNLKRMGYIVDVEDKIEIYSPLFERFLNDLFNNNNVPESYKGDKPYIFLSYAHTDLKIVYPLIAKLQEAGFRVWYDEGIPTSAKWKEEIEQRIKKSEKFIFFLSKNSCISNEVNVELEKYITFSGRGKYINDFIMIVLDEIKLCKNEGTSEYVDFVISDCNGLHISKDDESFFVKLSDKLGIDCKDQK